MAYKHKRWVRVTKQELAKVEQSTVNAVRWHAATGVTDVSLLTVDAKLIQYILANPAFMRHKED